MLTRFRFRRDFRLFSRCLSDKPSDGEGKPSEEPIKVEKKSQNDSENATEKIQALLKSMMTAPKISESEYRERFTVAPDRRRKLDRDEIEVKTEKIEESITKAAGDVAQAIGGNVKQTEAELLSRVLGKINQTSTNLSDLLIGMKVDRNTERDDVVAPSRGQQVKRNMDAMRENLQKTTRYSQRQGAPAGSWRPDQEGQAVSRRIQQEGQGERKFTKKSLPQPTTVDIFGGQPLGIFSSKQPNYGTKLDVWDSLKQRELNLATAQPPANYFQKMILWTEQGKVWKFPIDNEQGMEEEQNIHFSEHIFLDSHLEDWCPKRGPIRHFMELVCVGLSKNPFYTVKEKKDHILWYKEYFEGKKDLLSEVGAWDAKPKSSETSL